MNQVREGVDDLADKGMPALPLNTQRPVEARGCDSKFFPDFCGQPVRVLRCDGDDVAADLILKSRRCIERDNLSKVQHKNPIATVPFIDQVRRYKNRHAFLLAQLLKIQPQVMARPGMVALDLSDLEFLGVAGLSVLLDMQQLADEAGTAMLLVGSPAPLVERLLGLVGWRVTTDPVMRSRDDDGQTQ